MRCFRIQGGGIVSVPDFNDLRLTAGGETMRFSFDHYAGPLFIGKRGRETQWHPPYNHAFWDALQWWCLQGNRVVDGKCVYEPMTPLEVEEAIQKRNA